MMERIEAARRRDYLLMLEGYCDDPDCPARTVEIAVKDHDVELLPLLKKHGGLTCPVCRKTLKLHFAITQAQNQERIECEARSQVAMQMYRRDNPYELAMSMAVVADDRLPPTPEGWWEREETRRQLLARKG